MDNNKCTFANAVSTNTFLGSETPGLLCFWDFNRKLPYQSFGRYNYTLQASDTSIELIEEGPLSGSSVYVKEHQYLSIPRNQCPGLDIHGKCSQVTICAWVKRHPKSFNQCEAIAGMWNETEKKRQYCLFLNISLYDSGHQVCGHISGVGGPTTGNKWCVDVSIGQSQVPFDAWQFVAFTYDGKQACSYLNGRFEERPDLNPYQYEEGIFDGGEHGSDFTVGAVHRLGEMGNNFVGAIGGLAVFDRALSPEEMMRMQQYKRK